METPDLLISAFYYKYRLLSWFIEVPAAKNSDLFDSASKAVYNLRLS
jgi:hypothetical protein